jgi:hypothetical protein
MPELDEAFKGKQIYSINGGFLKWGYPKMDGLEWKLLLTWMI